MRCFFLIALLLISNILISQKLKWGKVPEEDLKMTVYELEPDADAVMLGDVMEARFNYVGEKFIIEYKIHKRVKILKESGFDWGDVSVYYQHYNKLESLFGLKAQVIQPNGEKISIKNKDIFEEKISKYTTKLSFALPQIQEGSVIEWTYSINSENYTYLEDKYFQYSIPCRHSSYYGEFPEEFNYVSITQGAVNMETSKKEVNKSYPWGNSGVQYFHDARNVPSLKEEAFITTMNDYRSRLRMQLSEINFPGSLYKRIMSDWSTVGNELNDNEQIGRQCNRKVNYRSVLDELGEVEGVTEKEKLEAIAKFVTSKIEWNERYGIQANETLNKVFEKRSGNGAALNLMMVALLSENGIQAKPALISTRSNGSPMPLYPVMNQFNHLIVRAEIDGKVVFVDVSDELRSVHCLRTNSLNGKAFVVEKDQSRWEDVLPGKGVDSYYINATIDEEGTMSGSFLGRYIGYNAIPERRAFTNDDTGSHWQERMERKFSEVEVEEIQCKELKNTNKNFTDEFEFSIEEAWTDGGDKLFLDPILYTAQLDENPFKLEERTYAVDIPYPFKEQYVFNLTLPIGYKIAEMPIPIKLGLPNNAGKFTYAVSQTQNKVQLVASFSINQLKFKPEEYEGLKLFYERAIEKYTEQLVFVKE